jgi:hypothetical protein
LGASAGGEYPRFRGAPDDSIETTRSSSRLANSGTEKSNGDGSTMPRGSKAEKLLPT